jgi:transposase
MSIVKGTSNKELRKLITGSHPIIQHYINKLNLPDIFRTNIISDKRLAIPAADCICMLIHNILTEPMALYKLPEWLETLDMEALGFPQCHASQFNDDRIARLLDSVYESNRKKIFFRIALRSIKMFELNCKNMHNDTTTIKLYGKYKNWELEPLACNGISKDHRPDLKQLVLGLNICGDGAIPLSHDVHSGNRTDDTTHISNWDHLRRLLQTNDFIYTADSKLCTEKNLSHIEFYNGQYITVMPRTWKEDQLFRKEVIDGNVSWKLILSRPSNRHPNTVIDKYYTTKTEPYQGKNRRIIWIKSSQKEEVDQSTREDRIKQSIRELNAINSKINRYNLKQLKDIKTAINTILKTNHTKHLIKCSIGSRTIVKNSYKAKGRPGLSSPKAILRKKEYCVIFEIDNAEVCRQKRADGVFPLITNNQTKSAKEILETYEFQSFLEKRHSQIKSVLEIAPVYLKKPRRVLALIDIVVIALSVASLMERDLRLGMIKHGIDSLPVYPEKRECKHPTTQSIVRVFSSVEKYELLDRNGQGIEYFPPNLSSLQKQILELMEVPIGLFV